jgi:hypothetical protein
MLVIDDSGYPPKMGKIKTITDLAQKPFSPVIGGCGLYLAGISISRVSPLDSLFYLEECFHGFAEGHTGSGFLHISAAFPLPDDPLFRCLFLSIMSCRFVNQTNT